MGKIRLSSLLTTTEFPFWPSHWAGQHTIPVRSYTIGHDAKALGRYFWLSQSMFSILRSCIMKREEILERLWKVLSAYASQLEAVHHHVFIWEGVWCLTEKWVTSLLLPDSISLPNILLFFLHDVGSFSLGCINIYALVSPLQSLSPCPSPGTLF